MRLISWNVNGIRAATRKGFLDWMQADQADIVCVQEIKAMPEQLGPELTSMDGYHITWNPAKRKGYSGVATFSRVPPKATRLGIGIERFDIEGRVIETEFEQFTLFNVYFPNGGQGPERVDFKLDFYHELLKLCRKRRREKKKLIICGDFNTAHKEIDLARPKQNVKVSGFMPKERVWIDKYLKSGLRDCFRMINKDPKWYTWWSYRTAARARNIGWRIDYHMISKDLKQNLKDAFILREVEGSDHCPIGIELDFSELPS